MDEFINGWVDDGLIDSFINRWAEEWMDKWMDEMMQSPFFYDHESSKSGEMLP